MISNKIVVNYKVEFPNLSTSKGILGPQMVSNKKVINYKGVDHVKIYNFDIKFVFIQLNLKSYEFYYVAA
jgi:hypothetical protein